MAGISLVQALWNKYRQFDEPIECLVFIPKNTPTVSNSGNHIKFIPPTLVLNQSQICSCGDEAELKKHCTNVTELDLAVNQISEWKEIKKMLVTLEQINFLNLSSNPLSGMTIEDDHLFFPNITKLVLNDTKIKQPQVQKLLQAFPSLQELHLSLNDYTSVTLDGIYPELLSLHFNGNKITRWDDLAILGGCFPNLGNLVVMDTNISEFGVGGEIIQAFPKLKCLNISKTNFTEWEEIEKINNFPSLQEVRITSIPLLEKYEEDNRRPLAVAYLSKINQLNGSKIFEDEREDGERQLIRYFMDAENKPSRFYELEIKHGKLNPLVELDLKPQTSVSVTVKFDERCEVVTFPLKDTLIEAKKRLEAFTNLKYTQFKLYHLDLDGWVGADEMRFPNRTLLNYGVKDGDEITVHPKH